MIYTVPAETRLCCDLCGAEGPLSSWELGVLELTLRNDVEPGTPVSRNPPAVFHYCGTCARHVRATVLGWRADAARMLPTLPTRTADALVDALAAAGPAVEGKADERVGHA